MEGSYFVDSWEEDEFEPTIGAFPIGFDSNVAEIEMGELTPEEGDAVEEVVVPPTRDVGRRMMMSSCDRTVEHIYSQLLWKSENSSLNLSTHAETTSVLDDEPLFSPIESMSFRAEKGNDLSLMMDSGRWRHRPNEYTLTFTESILRQSSSDVDSDYHDAPVSELRHESLHSCLVGDMSCSRPLTSWQQICAEQQRYRSGTSKASSMPDILHRSGEFSSDDKHRPLSLCAVFRPASASNHQDLKSRLLERWKSIQLHRKLNVNDTLPSARSKGTSSHDSVFTSCSTTSAPCPVFNQTSVVKVVAKRHSVTQCSFHPTAVERECQTSGWLGLKPNARNGKTVILPCRVVMWEGVQRVLVLPLVEPRARRKAKIRLPDLGFVQHYWKKEISVVDSPAVVAELEARQARRGLGASERPQPMPRTSLTVSQSEFPPGLCEVSLVQSFNVKASDTKSHLSESLMKLITELDKLGASKVTLAEKKENIVALILGWYNVVRCLLRNGLKLGHSHRTDAELVRLLMSKGPTVDAVKRIAEMRLPPIANGDVFRFLLFAMLRDRVLVSWLALLPLHPPLKEVYREDALFFQPAMLHLVLASVAKLECALQRVPIRFEEIANARVEPARLSPVLLQPTIQIYRHTMPASLQRAEETNPPPDAPSAPEPKKVRRRIPRIQFSVELKAKLERTKLALDELTLKLAAVDRQQQQQSTAKQPVTVRK